MITDATITTQLVQFASNYPIQIGIVAFFTAMFIGLFRQEMSKF